MSKTEKLLSKFLSAKKDFLWSDIKSLLMGLGFTSIEGSGSRVKFINGDILINLHKPHPQKEIKSYVIRHVKEILRKEGMI